MTLDDESKENKKVRFIVEAPTVKTPHLQSNAFLSEGLALLGLTVSSENQKKIIDYVNLMIKWNRAYNLTSVREPSEILTRHIFDSLAAGAHLHGENIIDVGSGAGLPGIPLALAYPDKQFTLLDSNGKKARFLFHVQHALDIPNVFVVNERVEGYQKFNDLKPGARLRRFDTIISRAFSSLRDMLYNTEHLCETEGMFLAMKGVYPLTELHELPAEFNLHEVLKLDVPFLSGERHLVKIKFE